MAIAEDAALEPDRPDARDDVWGSMPNHDWPAGDEFPTIEGYKPPRIDQSFEGKLRMRGEYRAGHPEGIIVHHLAGRDGAERAMRAAVHRQAFKYDTIGSDGAICLAGAYDRYGYHAGSSFHPQLGHGVSRFLHGVEVTTAGLLKKGDDGKLYAWWGDAIPEERARFVRKGEWPNVTVTGWYHAFSPEQEKSLVWLIKYYKIVFGQGFRYCLGHDEVAVRYSKRPNGKPDEGSVDASNFKTRLGRKNDPGGSLSVSMDLLRERVELDKGW